MRKDETKEIYFKWILGVTCILLLAFLMYLYSFYLIKLDVNKNTNIPSLNVSQINSLKEKISSRKDIDTQGKPNLSTFSFGNPEPF